MEYSTVDLRTRTCMQADLASPSPKTKVLKDGKLLHILPKINPRSAKRPPIPYSRTVPSEAEVINRDSSAKRSIETDMGWKTEAPLEVMITLQIIIVVYARLLRGRENPQPMHTVVIVRRLDTSML